MKFLVDNSLSPKLATALREMGYDAVHVMDYDMAEAADESILERAESESRSVLTADMDFPLMLALGGKRKPSLIMFRHNVRSPARQIERIRQYLADLRADLEEGAIVTFTDGVVRVRRLPVGWLSKDDS